MSVTLFCSQTWKTVFEYLEGYRNTPLTKCFQKKDVKNS